MGKSRLKPAVFSFFIIVFYSIAVSFLLVYVYTPSGRRRTISALNPFAPRPVLIKNSLTLYFSLHFFCFCIDFIEFSVRQPVFFHYTAHFELFRQTKHDIMYSQYGKRTVIQNEKEDIIRWKLKFADKLISLEE